jgi:hypothetical protein
MKVDMVRTLVIVLWFGSQRTGMLPIPRLSSSKRPWKQVAIHLSLFVTDVSANSFTPRNTLVNLRHNLTLS